MQSSLEEQSKQIQADFKKVTEDLRDVKNLTKTLLNIIIAVVILNLMTIALYICK